MKKSGFGDPPRVASYGRTAEANPEHIAEQHARNAEQAARHGFAIPEGAEYQFSDDGLSGHSPTLQYAASYGRKSEPNEQGVRHQHEGNAERAQRDGYTIPASSEFHYDDDHTSGVTTSRSGWDRLVAVVESGQAPFTRVYIKDRTRLGRWSDPRVQFYWVVHFEKFGVRICFSELEHQPDYSSDAPDQGMIGYFLKDAVDAVVASEERKRLIRRITGGMRQRVKDGFFPGSRAPYGMERWLADEKTGALVEPVPDGKRLRRDGCNYRLRWCGDERGEAVRQIFEWIEAGLSLASIAARLNESGAPPPARAPWSPEGVRRVARNPIYCGDLVWGRLTREGEPVEHPEAEVNGEAAIRVRGFLPDAPISRAQFEVAQQILAGNRARWSQRRATAPAYALSGLIECAHCGGGWHGFTSVRQEQGRRRRYYRHEYRRGSKGAEQRCPAYNRYLRAAGLEEAVLNSVLQMLDDDQLVALVEQALTERRELAGSKTREAALAKAEQRLKKKMAALDRTTYAEMMAESETERASYRRVAEGLSREVGHLRGQICEMGMELDRLARMEHRVASLTERARHLREIFAGASAMQRKEVLATLVNRIVVDPDSDHILLEVRAL